MIEKDVAVIGAGPGGYVAAIRAGQLGLDTICIERGALGGVCCNIGCIPTKALIRSAELYATIKQASQFGINVDNVSLDYPAMVKREQAIVKRSSAAVGGLLKSAGVQVLPGAARLEQDRTISVTTGDGKTETVQAASIIIATGSSPARPPVPGMELAGVIDSTGALELDHVPPRLTIIGGGVIGVEFGCLFANLGSQVTIVEMLPSIIATEDEEIIQALGTSLKRLGVKLLTSTTLQEIRQSGSGQTSVVQGPEGSEDIEGDCVLVATGRVPNTRDLGLEGLGIAMNRGWITVDDEMQTNVRGVYAVGDVNGRSLLAHAAFAQGAVTAERIAGQEPSHDLRLIPSCIYTIPEIASVGLTERQARESHAVLKIGKFPFSANGKAQCVGETAGFVKVVADAEYGEILGVHIYGHEASSLIMEGALGIRLEAALEDLYGTIHPHPTLTESLGEAAAVADGVPIHWPKAV